ncbi:MAG: hypothetical protein QF718_06370 [Phycisphaerales bacterium]|jgi:hypothetical protein|nr:hypothetical protein [Phycisphaerales bacterium]
MSEKSNNLDSRCVVLVPAERIDAAHLLAQKNNLQITIEHDPFLAMAEICLQQQQLRTNSAWNETPNSPHLIIVHSEDFNNVNQMVDSIRRYLPSVSVSELRDGRLDSFENRGSLVDSLEEPPIIQSENVDADELSMLLDDIPQGSKE